MNLGALTGTLKTTLHFDDVRGWSPFVIRGLLPKSFERVAGRKEANDKHAAVIFKSVSSRAIHDYWTIEHPNEWIVIVETLDTEVAILKQTWWKTNYFTQQAVCGYDGS
jgi:hypothetical protein